MIPVTKLYEYSIDFLVGNKTHTCNKGNRLREMKISDLSTDDLIYLSREGTHYHLLILLLLDKLDQLNYTYGHGPYDSFLMNKQLINELLLVPEPLFWITDKPSHARFCALLDKHTYGINAEYRNYIQNLETGAYTWTPENDAYIRECLVYGAASSYNGAAGTLKRFKRGFDKGFHFFTGTGNCISTHDDYMNWVKNTFRDNTLTDLVEREQRIVFET